MVGGAAEGSDILLLAGAHRDAEGAARPDPTRTLVGWWGRLAGVHGDAEGAVRGVGGEVLGGGEPARGYSPGVGGGWWGVVGVLGVREGFCWSRGVTGWWGGVWGRGGAGGFGVRIGVRVGLELVEGLGFG